jgi:hypothetical protein
MKATGVAAALIAGAMMLPSVALASDSTQGMGKACQTYYDGFGNIIGSVCATGM